MSDLELIQGSPEWIAARCGSLGGSRIADAVARTKSGWGASRSNLMADLIAERLTGAPTDTFVNAAMQRGTEKEPMARAVYEFLTDQDCIQVGLIRHPRIKGAHSSPDGLVGTEGAIEIKAPNTSTHLDTLLGAPIADRYIKQMQWFMACCPGRLWVDFVSFDDRLPEPMRLHIRRVERVGAMISELEKMVAEFIAELDAKINELTEMYMKQEAA